MKRLIFYVLITALVLWIPVQSSDVGKLRPVQVVVIRKQAQQVVILTDTADKGQGNSCALAMQDLHNSTPAAVYLDTAEFLLIGEGAQEDAQYLRGLLKKDVQVYLEENVQDLSLAAQYLSVHGGGTPFSLWEKGAALPVLREEAGRMNLSKNMEKTA